MCLRGTSFLPTRRQNFFCFWDFTLTNEQSSYLHHTVVAVTASKAQTGTVVKTQFGFLTIEVASFLLMFLLLDSDLWWQRGMVGYLWCSLFRGLAEN
jgi:hypothetical protein